MPFRRVCDEFMRRAGYAPSRSTFSRWVRNGVELPSGRTVKLAAQRIGRRWFCDAAAIDAFLTELAAG